MLFLFDHRLLHCNVMFKRTNLQSCPVRTCQMHKCELARQSTLQNFLKVGITTGNYIGQNGATYANINELLRRVIQIGNAQ